VRAEEINYKKTQQKQEVKTNFTTENKPEKLQEIEKRKLIF
jgi:hypothetical protein